MEVSEAREHLDARLLTAWQARAGHVGLSSLVFV